MTRLRLLREHPVVASALVLLLTFAIGSILYPNFASVGVTRNLVVDNSYLLVTAIGMTFVILGGGIDLSVGSLVAFTSILMARLVEIHGLHPIAAMGVALAAGAIFGLAQGIVIHAFRLPGFLVTLAGMFAARGLAFVVYPQSLGVRHPFIATTLNETASLSVPLGPHGTTIPIIADVAVAALALAAFVLGHLRFGRAVRAVGSDEAAARLLGVDVGRARVGTYVVSGACASLAGILFLLYQESGDPAACKGFELDAIAAVVIGGTLLRGGVGSVVGTAIGVLILGLVQTLITFQGNLSSWWTRIVAGALVLAFVVLHRSLSRDSDGRSRPD